MEACWKGMQLVMQKITCYSKPLVVSCHHEYGYTWWKLVFTATPNVATLFMAFSVTCTICKRLNLDA